jgi:hypothetical protein
MKRQLIAMAISIPLLAMVSCGGGIGGGLSSTAVDLNVLENKDEAKKIYDDIVKHLGDQITTVDEINIYVENPDEETIKKEGDQPTMSLRLDVLHPGNAKKIQRHQYWSEYGGWQAPETMEVELSMSTSKEDKENFVLAEIMWNFKEKVNYETFSKVIAESIARNQNPDKYTYRYIQNINISDEGYSISIHAKLKSNDQMMNEYYHYDFSGKPLD